MGLFTMIKEVRGGYPGGWKKYSHGKTDHSATPPFAQPTNPDDRRSLIPATGLREYWYPLLPAKDVGKKRPAAIKILDTELVLFRDKKGEVQAFWDYCPHRGVYLSWGNCYWNGLLSCPYHGATFDGDGECVEFITEGPDSKMVGALKARKYPTVTLKGVVFVWMGEGEPVPYEEDIPPEFFEGVETQIFSTFRYWDCNWMVALENTSDAHNCFYVHKNAIRVMFSARGDLGGRPRTPLGYRSELINGKTAMVVNNPATASYYADKNGGVIPYKMYYPRADAYWPLSSWRKSWVWFFKLINRSSVRNYTSQQGGQQRRQTVANLSEDWQGGGMRLPGMQRLVPLYTRWCVPVDKDMTRAIYIRFRRHKTRLGRLWDRIQFKGLFEFLNNFNFSDQDYNAMRSTRWQYPEYLSATDSHVVAERRLIAEHGRGLKRDIEVKEVTTAERQVIEGHEALGVKVEGDYGVMNTGRSG